MTSAYPCPCCGYTTLGAPPPGTYLVCPVCFWEDLPVEQSSPRGYCHALREAQRTFLATGACLAQYVHMVRPPSEDERRSPGWQTIDTLVERLDDEIRVAFADVSRADGISLHEADVLDDYGSEAALAAARQRDTDRHWQEVPDAVIAKLSSALSFLDDKGFHYYLPAYLSWTLRHYDSSASASIHSLLTDLALQPWDHSQREQAHEATIRTRFERLTDAQAQVVCQALRFLAAYGYPCVNVKLARKALDQYWSRFCSGSVA